VEEASHQAVHRGEVEGGALQSSLVGPTGRKVTVWYEENPEEFHYGNSPAS
jgi:hypothetical protein